MQVFITGGSGFLGGSLIRKLVDAGVSVKALARSERSAARVEALGATAVRGDIVDKRSMAAGMQGCDVVYHLAAWYQIGSAETHLAEHINVDGTRNVLTLAGELSIPKIVYTSTIAVYGDTKGELVDENFRMDGPFATEYDRTKWLAHYEVALPLIEQGLPIVIVQPGAIFGPGDTSTIHDIMQLWYQGWLPVVPGPETAFCWSHVDDIAQGLMLAAEKGVVGESYNLTGPAVPLGEMVDFWASITGRKAPITSLPAAWVRPSAPLMDLIGRVIPLPSAFSGEATGLLGSTYIADSTKAREQLGWRSRSLQSSMLETFEWIAESSPEKNNSAEPYLIGIAVTAAVFILWRILRRGRRAK